MIKSEEKLKDLATRLNSKDNDHICEVINQLRKEIPFTGAIGMLTGLFDKVNDSSIRSCIAQFMNDLKDQGASSEIIAETKKQWKSETLTMLVSSCWQSGLDYSDYSMDITRIFLKGDYSTSLECLTVIDELTYHLTNDKKHELIRYIKENHFTMANENRELAQEMLRVLER